MRKKAKENFLKALTKHPVIKDDSTYCHCEKPELVGSESPRYGKELGIRWCKSCKKCREVVLEKEYIWVSPRRDKKAAVQARLDSQ